MGIHASSQYLEGFRQGFLTDLRTGEVIHCTIQRPLKSNGFHGLYVHLFLEAEFLEATAARVFLEDK